jgi:hypothetical protein
MLLFEHGMRNASLESVPAHDMGWIGLKHERANACLQFRPFVKRPACLVSLGRGLWGASSHDPIMYGM